MTSFTRPLFLLCAGVCVTGLHAGVLAHRVHAQDRGAARLDVRRLQSVVDDLRSRLLIPQPVTVSIVPENALVTSVEAPRDPGSPFQLAIEAAFLDVLTEAELEAVLAHELGHVWVFTHHPYLQTEQLANSIAMRVTHREALERVYEKVWKRGGAKGDMTRFLGTQPTAGLADPESAR